MCVDTRLRAVVVFWGMHIHGTSFDAMVHLVGGGRAKMMTSSSVFRCSVPVIWLMGMELRVAVCRAWCIGMTCEVG